MISLLTRLVSAFPTAPQPSPRASSSSPITQPSIIYGTAWKRERTTELVLQALRAGYRAVDTACQPKHYREELVGSALAAAEAEGIMARADVHLQTKFTPLAGQDPENLPYDASAPLEEQVKQSMAASLRNLRTRYVDCLILHSPLPSHAETMRVWHQMEAHVAMGEARSLGVSNMYDLSTLAKLHRDAAVKPAIVQNRFYADTGHDASIRKFCRENAITYQSFWTLTGNRQVVQGRAVREVARAHGCTAEQTWLAFVRSLGITPLSGTTSSEHMVHDLQLPTLRPAEVERLTWLIS